MSEVGGGGGGGAAAAERWDVLQERGGEDEQEREEDEEEEGVGGLGEHKKTAAPQEVTSNTAQRSLQERGKSDRFSGSRRHASRLLNASRLLLLLLGRAQITLHLVVFFFSIFWQSFAAVRPAEQ